jgi:hypothetical protein
MRRQEIRAALPQAFQAKAPCGWRDVVADVPVNASSPSEVRLVRWTVENMVRAGELVPVGQAKAAGSRVWHALYEPAAWSKPEEELSAEQMREESLRAIGVVTGSWRQGGP